MSQTHLLRRNGVFYYQRRVPRPLIQRLGKKVIFFTLGTKELKEAKKLRDLEDVRWNARFETKELTASKAGALKPGPKPQGLLQIVREYVEKADERSRTLLLADPLESMAQKADVRTDTEIGLSILKNLDDPRGNEWVHSTSMRLLGEECGGTPDSISLVFSEIVRRGLLELQNRRLTRLDDDFSRPFFDPAFSPQNAAPQPTFGQLADQFIDITDENARVNGTSQKWVDKQRSNVAALKEIVGEGTPISSVDFDVCMRVRTVLAGIPANRTKVYGSAPLEEAIERAKFDGKPLLSPVTQDQYLATFRAILDLAAKKRLIGVNPASDLKPLKKDTVAAGEKRLPLTPQQLNEFFRGTYYRSCAERASPPYSHDRAGWRFWMPLLTLFMGMRPNEICQLLASDVKTTEAGTPFINVVATDDDEDGEINGRTLKTATSRRRIPIHPEILALGFLEFSAKRQAFGGGARLFPELQPDEYGNVAKYALKRFRDDFLPRETKLGARQTYYSLRHNFRDALRRADAPPDALQALGGWSQGNLVSDRYGERDNPDYQVRFMAGVSFPGLDLSFLHVEKSPVRSVDQRETNSL